MGTIKKINVNIIETVGITFLQDPCSFSTISQCGTFTQIICRRTPESLDNLLSGDFGRILHHQLRSVRFYQLQCNLVSFSCYVVGRMSMKAFENQLLCSS
jgi:hypothetical protein